MIGHMAYHFFINTYFSSLLSLMVDVLDKQKACGSQASHACLRHTRGLADAKLGHLLILIYHTLRFVPLVSDFRWRDCVVPDLLRKPEKRKIKG